MRKLTALCCVMLLGAFAPMALALGPDQTADQDVGIRAILENFWEYLIATVLEMLPDNEPPGLDEGSSPEDPGGPSQEAFPIPDPIG